MDVYSDPTPVASAKQFKAALLSVRDRVDDMLEYAALLRAHYRAPAHTASTERLAKELGYASYAVANGRYGELAHKVADALGLVLPKTPSGDPHWWRTLAYGNDGVPVTDDGRYEWIMRPELAQALEELRWV
jgi:hypothetical protein